MKVAVLTELNGPLILFEVDIPDLSYGQVLVEVHCSGICGAQIGEISGANGEDRYLPHLLGHEGGGIVAGIGPGVTHVKEGDRVVMHWREGAGIDAKPPIYDMTNWEKKTVGGGPVTTFNQYAVVSENRLTPIGGDIPFDIAALMGCAVTTGLGLIGNEANLKIGQSIAVAGCGGVGLSVIQGAAMVSANPIIAIDLHREKLNMARRFGATHGMTGFGEGMKNVDVFVDCTGIGKVIDRGLTFVAPGGRAVLAGQPHNGQNLIVTNFRQHYCGKTILDSQGGLTDPNIDIPRYLDLYRTDRLNLDDLITHRFPLEKVNDALDTIRSGMAGRCILEMR